MTVTQTKLNDCYIIQPKVFEDYRGYFFESFNEKTFAEAVGHSVHFVQDNEAKSDKGILRGLHRQMGEFAQAKLVRVTQGRVLDVVVDMRSESSTYLQHVTMELSASNRTQLFVPRGFLHGYSVLENGTVFCYKCDNYYAPNSESGIRFDEPTFQIDWMLKPGEIILSEKDKSLPFIN